MMLVNAMTLYIGASITSETRSSPGQLEPHVAQSQVVIVVRRNADHDDQTSHGLEHEEWLGRPRKGVVTRGTSTERLDIF